MIPTIESQNNRTSTVTRYDEWSNYWGADPIHAVQFQLLIIFALLTTATLSSVMIGF